MNQTAIPLNEGADIRLEMLAVLRRQQTAFVSEGPVSAQTRIERLQRVIDMIMKYKDRLYKTMSSDFGHRSINQSSMTDISASLRSLKDAQKNLGKWMKQEKRKPMFPLGFLGAKARVEYQPLGVVGCIAPWNFPMQLALQPLAGILAAGNRAMIKLSEHTPQTSELMQKMFTEAFSPDEIAVFTGGVEVAEAFSSLPFDHLVFTGAHSVAKHVMQAAAQNLVPVTLELGGKSPVVLGQSADIQDAAAKVMLGKTMNAGQICLSPDYVFVPQAQLQAFIEAARQATATMYPNLRDNPDYTSIINEQHFNRLQGYLADAREKGAEIIEFNPGDEDFSQQEFYRIAPTLIINPAEDMAVMREEIFGPLMPVKTYNSLDEVLDYINGHDTPLALYYFGRDKAEETRLLAHTRSGGVTVNDVMLHAAQDDLPFGGVGASGQGAYRGQDGFKRFSHARAVFSQSKQVSKLAAKMRPPYKK